VEIASTACVLAGLSPKVGLFANEVFLLFVKDFGGVVEVPFGGILIYGRSMKSMHCGSKFLG
jgi:hypothetical protein